MEGNPVDVDVAVAVGGVPVTVTSGVGVLDGVRVDVGTEDVLVAVPGVKDSASSFTATARFCCAIRSVFSKLIFATVSPQL